MAEVAKIFMSGGSQAVRLPRKYRFPDQEEVLILREGNRVILEPVRKALERELPEPQPGALPIFPNARRRPLRTPVRTSTDACATCSTPTSASTFLTGRYLGVVRRIKAERPDRLAVSSVSVAELRFGAEKSAKPQQNHRKLDQLFEELPTVDFDLRAAAIYGRVRQSLEKEGTPIGPYDLQIAAHALALELILVTDNEGEFRRVQGLSVENWRKEQAGSSTPGADMQGVPVFALAAAAFLVFVLLFAVGALSIFLRLRALKRREEALRPLAQTLRLSYADQGRPGAGGGDRAAGAFAEEGRRTGGECDARRAARDRLRSDGLQLHDRQRQAPAAPSPDRGALPNGFSGAGLLYLRPESFLDKIGDLLGGQDIDFPHRPGFSKRYYLRAYAADGELAKEGDAPEFGVRALFGDPVLNRLEQQERGVLPGRARRLGAHLPALRQVRGARGPRKAISTRSCRSSPLSAGVSRSPRRGETAARRRIIGR